MKLLNDATWPYLYETLNLVNTFEGNMAITNTVLFYLLPELYIDNDGNALGDGALYFNTTTDDMWVYNLSTTTWFAVADGALLTANNLNDVANAATSLSNIGGVGVGLALALGG